jgi:hypothetical protein
MSACEEAPLGVPGASDGPASADDWGFAEAAGCDALGCDWWGSVAGAAVGFGLQAMDMTATTVKANRSER